MYSRGLFIFRQDLRVQDNTALLAASAHCKELVLVFIFDEEVLSRFSRPDGRVGFLRETVCTLRDDLRDLGSDLLIAHGTPKDLLPKLIQTYRIDALFRNRSYGVGSRTRDLEMHVYANAHDIAIHTREDYLLVEPVGVETRKVFTPYYYLWQNVDKRLPGSTIDVLPPFPVSGRIKTYDRLLQPGDLSVYERLGAKEQEYWSVDHARSRFALLPQEQYDEMRNRPDQDGTSLLSPYLRFGVYSPRQLLDRMIDTTTPGTTWEDGTVRMQKKVFQNSFVSELAWREFWWHIDHRFPETRLTAFQEKRRHIDRIGRDERFDARKEGRTGYPIVDAGMRQLHTMYRMHGRVRMIVASFLCKDLLIDRHRGEQHFADWLLDYDEAVNRGNRQRSASVGADPKPLRIFNPLLQSQKFDPDAVYIKQRLPELAHHTPEQLHDPLSYTLDRHEPIVNHFEMSKRAREVYKGIVQEGLF